jgi:hypothetical protein
MLRETKNSSYTFLKMNSPGEWEVCLDDEVADSVGLAAPAAAFAFAVAESSAA